jgi:hypothetical protein
LDQLAGETANGPVDLKEFTRHYTMHAEREVHESVVRGDVMCAPAADGLGDNVELF